MRGGEEVTFGTSGLDRAAALRGQPEALARLQAQGRVLPVCEPCIVFVLKDTRFWLSRPALILAVFGTTTVTQERVATWKAMTTRTASLQS